MNSKLSFFFTLNMDSFAHQLRQSAFVSLGKNQVIKTTKELRRQGEWGLKHTMKVPHKFIQVPIYDQKQFKTAKVESGQYRVDSLARWKELFPTPRQMPDSAKDEFLSCSYNFDTNSHKVPMKPLSLLDKSEWTAWLNYAKSLRPSFLESIKLKKADETSWNSALGLNKLPTYPSKIFPIVYSTTTQPDPQVKVIGRILGINRAKNVLEVGVQGFKATANYQDSYNSKALYSALTGDQSKLRDTEHEFWVESAYHNSKGEPVIHLTTKNPNQVYSGVSTSSTSDNSKSSSNPFIRETKRVSLISDILATLNKEQK
ncbi:hypothetical protein BC833DRAFT_582518 [Globomyces pollinis-pini]|nr:hypothetical protein BC833DRAFT_582518 [Globomyces pollinis-pini]